VQNNLERINKELGETYVIPESEYEAKKLYIQWLDSLAARGVDL
jgi:hypothetical protein